MADIITGITDVFSAMGTWIISYIPRVTEVFYNTTDKSFTLLGVLAVVALAISIFFLIMGLIQNFLHFRG